MLSKYRPNSQYCSSDQSPISFVFALFLALPSVQFFLDSNDCDLNIFTQYLRDAYLNEQFLAF